MKKSLPLPLPYLGNGPIEKSKDLIPQLRRYNKIGAQDFHEGCWLIFWGLFKKVYVGDNWNYTINLTHKSKHYNVTQDPSIKLIPKS